MVVPGLLQIREYARAIAAAAGADDPDAIAAERLRRQEALALKDAPRFEVVLDARALLYRAFPVEVLRDQVTSLVERVRQPRIDLQVVPLGVEHDVVSAVGFTIYEFRQRQSPPVVWIESPTGDVYFSAADDVEQHATLFRRLRGVALGTDESARYLEALVPELERYARQATVRR